MGEKDRSTKFIKMDATPERFYDSGTTCKQTRPQTKGNRVNLNDKTGIV